MANETKQVYDSAQTVISKGATLANAANTVDADATALNNSLNYPYGRAVLGIPDTFAAAPTAGSTVDLYMIIEDVDSTSDETPVPAATDIIYLGKNVGSFIIDDQDVANIKAIIISLLGVVKARYYIINNTGQTLSYTSNPITVKITPFTFAPS